MILHHQLDGSDAVYMLPFCPLAPLFGTLPVIPIIVLVILVIVISASTARFIVAFLDGNQAALMLQGLGQCCACSHATEVLGIEDLKGATPDPAPDGLRGPGSHVVRVEVDQGEFQAVFAGGSNAQIGEGEEAPLYTMFVLSNEWRCYQGTHESTLLSFVGCSRHGGSICIGIWVPESAMND